MKEFFYKDLLFIQKIISNSDYFWPPSGERYERQFSCFKRGLFNFENVKPNSIIHADLIGLRDFYLFNKIKVPFILISSEMDYSVQYLDTKKKSEEYVYLILKLL